ncbi:MAG: hypothetical protein O2944_09610, partial [Proteobacteria bacterium]|nr:hypothetical protein [Pseudomonadota bacterium]
MRGMIFVYVLLASVIGVLNRPALAEVPVGASMDGKVGVVTFGWRNPVAYETRVDNDRLTLRFSEPVGSGYGVVVAKLGSLVEWVRPGGDGKTLIFGFKRPTKVFAYYAGTAVMVELVPMAPRPNAGQSAAKDPDGAAAEIRTLKIGAQAVKATGLPKIGVRTGVHADYTRIVFDWTEDVAYKLSNQGGVVSIVFQRPAEIDLGRIERGKPRLIGAARSVVGPATTTVTLAVPAAAEIKDFLSGSKLVVDVKLAAG